MAKEVYDGTDPRITEPFRNCIIAAWSQRFGLTEKQSAMMTDEDYWQLSLCRTDECRRLLLGISEQFSKEERLHEREPGWRGYLESAA